MDDIKAKPVEEKTQPLINLGKDNDLLIGDLATLLNSGMGILPVLNTMLKETPSGKMKRAITAIREKIDNGKSLHKALSSSIVMPGYVVALIKIGEESGRLAENLRVISEQEQKDRVFRSKVASALYYPVFILIVAMILGIGISWFILPRLAQVFTNLHVELPLMTRIMIALGTFLRDHGIIVVPIFLAIIFITVYIIFINSKTRFIGHAILFKLPGTGRLIKETELARLGFVLGNLLEAGLPVNSAISALADSTETRHYKKFYNYLNESIDEGNSFEKSFEKYKGVNKILSVSIQQMIVVGEQAGSLAGSLQKIGKIYEEKNELTSRNLAIIIEPVMLIVVWFVVLFLALAVIMPIYNMLSGIS